MCSNAGQIKIYYSILFYRPNCFIYLYPQTIDIPVAIGRVTDYINFGGCPRFY